MVKPAGASLALMQSLLETDPGGRVFTSEEAVRAGEALGLSSGHTYKLLTELAQKQLIDRPRTRLYAMRSPFGGLSPVRPLAVAVRAVRPSAVSGITALAHWDLVDQAALHDEVVSTPSRIQWAHDVEQDGRDQLWHVMGAVIRFRHIAADAMFGITTVRLDSETVIPMFDRERSIADLLTRRDDQEWAHEIIVTHRDEIDIDRLTQYAERLGVAKALHDRAIPTIAG